MSAQSFSNCIYSIIYSILKSILYYSLFKDSNIDEVLPNFSLMKNYVKSYFCMDLFLELELLHERVSAFYFV